MDRWAWQATVLGVTKSQTWLSERVQSSLAEEEGRVNYLGSTLGHSLSSPTLYMHDRVMPDCWRFSFYPHLHSNYFHYFLVKIGKKNSPFYFSQDFSKNWQDFVDSQDEVSGRWGHGLIVTLSKFCFVDEPALFKVHAIKGFSFSPFLIWLLLVTFTFLFLPLPFFIGWGRREVGVKGKEGFFIFFLDGISLILPEYLTTFIQNLMPHIFFSYRV